MKKVDSSTILVTLLLVAASIVFYRFYSTEKIETNKVRDVSSKKEKFFPKLVNNQKSEIFENLNNNERGQLKTNVLFFCKEEFHPDSCVHHLISCGEPCFGLLTPDERKRAHSSYVKLLDEKGL